MWPPQLQDLKDELGVTDNRDDTVLASTLDAAVAWVERELLGDFDFDGSLVDLAPTPTPDVTKGALMKASRLWARRRSPDGLVIDSGDLGSARVPTVDADIEQMLGVGRWRRPMV